MATTYLTRTPSSAGNRKKFTISMWVKRVKLGVDQWLVQAGASGSEFDIRFTTSDQIRFTTWDGSNGYGMITTRVFRDVSAWYHLVFQYDTAQATDTNRNKIYVNGEQISPSDTSAYNAGKHPPQNYDNPSWNNTTAFRINDVTWTSSSPKDAVYSHIHHTDGYAYDASTFGSTDATSGIWKINTSPSVTYGTNGFFILKDGNTITDSSPNSNNFSLGGGTLTNTEDCPDNNFSTLNPLYVINASHMPTLTNGNTTGTSTSSGFSSGVAGIAPTGSGKYYSEHKLISGTGGWDTNTFVGYSPTPNGTLLAPHDANFFYGVLADGGARQGATNRDGYAGTWTSGDIIRLALDLDNNRLYVGKNAYWSDGSGNWDEANINGYLDLTASPAVAGDNWFMICGDKNTSTATWGNNFGNGYFGTTAVASAGTAPSEGGIFEYDCPTGFQALCTKGINSF